MADTAGTIVFAFGFLILAMSFWGIADPKRLVQTVDSLMASSLGMVIAIGSRVLLGTALIVSAPRSRSPWVFLAIGVLSLSAAAALPFISRRNVQKLLRSIQRWPTILLRCWMLLGVAFGAFLIYGLATV